MTRLHEARISDREMRAFQKVAAIMADGQGRIDATTLLPRRSSPTLCLTSNAFGDHAND